jgi:NAD-dependent deacetylase
LTDFIKRQEAKKVYELHGSVHRNYCESCHKLYDAEYILKLEGIPTCSCGGRLKPDVVLYEEGLDDATLRNSISAIRNAEMMIIGGTSLVVYPAAGLIDYFQGKYLVLINKQATKADAHADLVIQEPIGEVFSKIKV